MEKQCCYGGSSTLNIHSKFIFKTPNQEDAARHPGSTSGNSRPENIVYGWYRSGTAQKYTIRVTLYLNKKFLPRLQGDDVVAQFIVQTVLVHKSGHWVRIMGLLSRGEKTDTDNPQFSLAGQVDENDKEEAGEVAEVSFIGGEI
jgi:hypothetical protein